MSIHKRKINPEDDLGFGSQPVVKNQRVINTDGSVNVKRRGLSAFSSSNNYHILITMGWHKFIALVVAGYLVVNLFFASIYFALGPGSIDGGEGKTNFTRYLDDLFFSAQTVSTVGYGHISPKGVAANSVAAIESMIGLLVFALATGLLYGRFSRPSARIKYSKNILIAPYLENSRGIMFRLANLRLSTLIDLEVEVIFSYNEDVNGKKIRRFLQLELERKTVSILTISWTVVHPLDEQSPLKDLTPEDLEQTEAVFAVLIKAFDDTFSQTVHSRTSYLFNEVVWGAKFKPTFERENDGRVALNLDKIDDFEYCDLNKLTGNEPPMDVYYNKAHVKKE